MYSFVAIDDFFRSIRHSHFLSFFLSLFFSSFIFFLRVYFSIYLLWFLLVNYFFFFLPFPKWKFSSIHPIEKTNESKNSKKNGKKTDVKDTKESSTGMLLQLFPDLCGYFMYSLALISSVLFSFVHLLFLCSWVISFTQLFLYYSLHRKEAWKRRKWSGTRSNQETKVW
jgi:hypothetical protein